MRSLNIALPMLMALALSACAHDWPPEARGGMAERDRPLDADIQNAVDRIAYLQSMPNQHPPAQLAEAQERMIRAQRESAGGLADDADTSYQEALTALDGGPERHALTPACLKQFCMAAK